MNTLSYKGYIGSIEISEEDNCLYGKVLDLPDDTCLTYEGVTVAQLREDFESTIEEYLLYCKSKGIRPKKSYSGTLNVRISPETHCRIAMIASQKGISINAFIRQTLDKQVAMI